MNIGQIQKLAEIARLNELSVLEINEGEIHIRMERGGDQVQPARALPPEETSATAQNSAPLCDSPIDFNHVYEVKSSLVGIFYAAPGPDTPPFVTVGGKVKKGDVLCVIEAMKLMNEITADQDGEVADVCVHNGDLVEFGQTLFKLC